LRRSSSRESLGPSLRIKKRREFLAIQATRRKVRSNTLLFAIIFREERAARGEAAKPEPGRRGAEKQAGQAPRCRIGITVTTKVHKRAVRRNRLKRFIREVFRKERRHLLAAADIVVIALEGSTELDYQAIRSEFRFAMRRAGLLPYRQKR
jgi:ribonuclease P protein component